MGVDSLVFVDDNPAEREIVKQQVSGVSVPEMTRPEEYINIIDKSGFFEMVNLSKDDLSKTKMYKENAQRNESMAHFTDYGEYLKSLDMKAQIKKYQYYVPE